MARARNKSKIEFDEAEHKLLLLYFIEKMSIPVPSNVIEEFILESNYMDYFKLTSCLADLQERDFIAKISNNNMSKFCITDAGHELLVTLETQVPSVVRNKIDTFVSLNKKDVKFAMEVSAIVYENPENNEFIVKCKAYDDINMLMEINVAVSSHKEARFIRQNWLDNVGLLYGNIMAELTINNEYK